LIKSGWPFALSLLAILGAHEFGHYFAGKKHEVQVTLPFFIPLPLSLFGTMGAFINMRSLPRNKRALFDLAISGPLSGLAVSIIALIIGLKLSTLSYLPLTPPPDGMLQMEGNSLLYLLMKFIIFGKWLPQPQDLSGLPLAAHWIQYFFTGQPFPWGALDVMIHPVAWAGWAGLFVTGVNLIPAGQLDGGHILYALFGHKVAQRIIPIIITALVVMGFFWNVWWMWAVLIFFLGRRHAEPLDQVTELDSKRRALGYMAIIVFILTFIPIPIMLIGG
jgi:membrane-associated protease RseP (regulator of RpoE activity)